MNTVKQATPENQDAKVYGRTFFEKQQNESLESARQVVPVIVSLFQPTSVVDVGCGVGFSDMSFTRKTWLLKKILAGMGRDVLNRITGSRRG